MVFATFADELEEFAGHGAAQTVDAGDTVTDLDDRADLAYVDLGLERLELCLEHVVDSTGSDLCHLRLTSLRCGSQRRRASSRAGRRGSRRARGRRR